MFKKLFGFGKKEKEIEEEVVEEVLEETAEEATEEATEEAIEEATEEATEEVVEETAEEVTDEVAEETAEEATEEATEEVAEENAKEATEEVAEETVEEIVEELAEEPLIEETPEVAEEFKSILEESPEEVVVEAPKKVSFFAKLKEGLSKTSKAITDKVDNLLNDYGKIDEDLFEELEEILIMADIGMTTTMDIIEKLREELVKRKITESSDIKPVLKDIMVEILEEHNDTKLNIDSHPSIIFVIGVNGAGKTTSIGKIAYNLKLSGKSVILAAADTFRAAAIDQLAVWAERVDVPIIAHAEGSDPAAVIFDAINEAKKQNTDVLICDTAGRLHNKKNLMNELAKMFSVIEREFPHAKKEILLVLDATTGQNAVQQAKLFRESADITGIVLTKLDGTAKGGVVLAINHELGIPVKLIGVGEGLDDLQVFDSKSFAEALLES